MTRSTLSTLTKQTMGGVRRRNFHQATVPTEIYDRGRLATESTTSRSSSPWWGKACNIVTSKPGSKPLKKKLGRSFLVCFQADPVFGHYAIGTLKGVLLANHSGGAVLYAPSTSQDMVTEVLKETVSIPPTIIKRNGERIQVLVMDIREIVAGSSFELE